MGFWYLEREEKKIKIYCGSKQTEGIWNKKSKIEIAKDWSMYREECTRNSTTLARRCPMAFSIYLANRKLTIIFQPSFPDRAYARDHRRIIDFRRWQCNRSKTKEKSVKKRYSIREKFDSKVEFRHLGKSLSIAERFARSRRLDAGYWIRDFRKEEGDKGKTGGNGKRVAH